MASIGKSPCDEATIQAGVFERTCAGNDFWVLAATILGSSMAFIDGTVVNVALPALQPDLRATIGEVQWVVESYGLFLAALFLVGGSLGDLSSTDSGSGLRRVTWKAAKEKKYDTTSF